MKYKEQTVTAKCANCDKQVKLSGYQQWCNLILQHKPTCSYECNKALRQVVTSAKEQCKLTQEEMELILVCLGNSLNDAEQECIWKCVAVLYDRLRTEWHPVAESSESIIQTRIETLGY